MHGGVLENAHRAERNDEPFRDVVERKTDLEAVLGYGQVPELVLQHDGHFVRILLLEPLRKADARRARIEGDEK